MCIYQIYQLFAEESEVLTLALWPPKLQLAMIVVVATKHSTCDVSIVAN